jgi:hypothetical protein
MNADVKGALEQINNSWKAFTHNGKRMTKTEVRKVLKFCIAKGYKTTAELKDGEVDRLLKELHRK